ncbi:MAG: hypothetical protein ACJ76J_14730 [Thermoanaerobaculia bacterium]
MRIDEEILRLSRLLESLVLVERVPVRELERRLGLGSGTLGRIFSGKIDLKVRHVLLVVEALGVKPMDFFEQAFKEVPEGEEGQAGARLTARDESLRRRPWLRLQAEPKPATLTDQDVRRVLVELLRQVGVGPRKAPRKPPPPKGKKGPPQKGR